MAILTVESACIDQKALYPRTKSRKDIIYFFFVRMAANYMHTTKVMLDGQTKPIRVDNYDLRGYQALITLMKIYLRIQKPRLSNQSTAVLDRNEQLKKQGGFRQVVPSAPLRTAGIIWWILHRANGVQTLSGVYNGHFSIIVIRIALKLFFILLSSLLPKQKNRIFNFIAIHIISLIK